MTVQRHLTMARQTFYFKIWFRNKDSWSLVAPKIVYILGKLHKNTYFKETKHLVTNRQTAVQQVY